MKIAYLWYDFFYWCLDILLENNFNVSKIFTFETDDIYNFNTNILNLANKNNIDVQYSRITSDDIEKLIEDKYDLIISAWYPYKIPVDSRIKIINIHPTLLPIWKWVWPLPYIILNKFEESWVTIHKVSDKLDSWDIIIQEKFRVDIDNENLETLSIKSQILAKKVILNLMNNFDYLYNNAKSQNWEWIYWAMPTESDMMLDFTKKLDDIKRVSRAFWKFDSCAIFDEKHFLVQDLAWWNEKHDFKPWTIIHRTNKEILIAVLDWYVCLRFFKEDPDYL